MGTWTNDNWETGYKHTEKDDMATIAKCAREGGARPKRQGRPIERYNNANYLDIESPPSQQKKARRRRDEPQPSIQRETTKKSRGKVRPKALKQPILKEEDEPTVIVKQEPQDQDELEWALGMKESQKTSLRQWEQKHGHLSPTEYEKLHVARFGIKPTSDANGNPIVAEPDSEDELLEAACITQQEDEWKQRTEVQQRVKEPDVQPRARASNTSYFAKMLFGDPPVDSSEAVTMAADQKGQTVPMISRQGANQPMYRQLDRTRRATRTGVDVEQIRRQAVRRSDFVDFEADENSAEDADYASHPDSMEVDEGEDEATESVTDEDDRDTEYTEHPLASITSHTEQTLPDSIPLAEFTGGMAPRRDLLLRDMGLRATVLVPGRAENAEQQNDSPIPSDALLRGTPGLTVTQVQKFIGRTPDYTITHDSTLATFPLHSTEVLRVGRYFYYRPSPRLHADVVNYASFPHYLPLCRCKVFVPCGPSHKHHAISAAVCDATRCEICFGENGLHVAKKEADSMGTTVAELLVKDSTLAAYSDNGLSQALRAISEQLD